jgi:hypothetical protein
MARTVFQNIWRSLVLAVVVLGTLAVPLPPFVLACVVGAFLAYDGAEPQTALTVVGALAVAELFFGVSLGVLSLGAVIAVVLVRVASRLATGVPLARHEGWPPAAFSVAVAFGTCAAVAMLVSGVAIAAVGYGAGFFALRVRMVTAQYPWWALPLAVAATLLVLRRVDTAFRKQIRFGQ